MGKPRKFKMWNGMDMPDKDKDFFSYNHWGRRLAPDVVRTVYYQVQKKNAATIEKRGGHSGMIWIKADRVTDDFLSRDDHYMYVLREFEDYCVASGVRALIIDFTDQT
jgi:hypothetical protein